MNKQKYAMFRNEGNSVKKTALLLRLAFLALSLFILLRIVDFKLVVRHVHDIPLFVLGILLTLGILHTWLSGIRWRLVNSDVSGQLSQSQYFQLMMMAKPFNLIMPGALGGDFMKMALTLKTVKNKRADNAIAIVADRFIGLFSITVLGSSALFFMSDIQDKKAFYGLFGILAVGFAASLLVAGNPWFLRLLESVFSRLGGMGKRVVYVLETWKDALMFYRHNYHRLLLALLLCLPIHGLSFVTTYILAVNLGIVISFSDICMILALVWVITAIPITISGVGVRELSLIYFLSLYGVKAESATALSVYLYIVSVILGLIGLVFLFSADPRLYVRGE